jgi:RNA polymerase-binding protein DksA
MVRTELKKFHRQLTDLRDRLTREDRELREQVLQPAGGAASGGISNAPLHLADLGTHEYEGEIALRLIDSEERALAEIVPALERIENGTFGKCESCGKRIVKERLQAIPYARFCVPCAEKHVELAE